MTDKEKIEYLLNLLRNQDFNMRLDDMSSLIQSYRWLIDKLREEESNANK